MKKDSGGSESKKSATKPKKKLSDKFWYMVSESEDSDEGEGGSLHTRGFVSHESQESE